MSYHCYFENEFHPLDTPLLKTNDLGLLRGFGLFDYLRTYNGVPFRFAEYWSRFSGSAASLGIEVPLDKEAVYELLGELYRLSGEADVAFRLLLTGGYAEDGLTVTQPNFIIRSEPLPKDNPAGRKTGIKVIPYEYVRDLPYVKTTGYVHMMKMSAELRNQMASDLLFHKDGLVSELTRSNIFIVRGDSLITPGKDALRGITRKLVMEKAAGKLEVQERDVSLDELLSADEVFTTSSTKGVMPIVQVGDKLIGSGAPGRATVALQLLVDGEFARYGK
ncbi:MAG: aminotransferase IV [Cytophagaceae bacterium SCN 52-12]|nr:MAG: aminotransferase IV [Cytophagaceae bacterium SCN 52-12]